MEGGKLQRDAGKPKKPEEEENTLESNTRNQKIWKQTYETTGRGKIW
jgi:hypothetical protein